VADPSTCADALDIVRRYGIALPEHVSGRAAKAAGANRSSRAIRAWPGHEVRMIATPQMALEAAARVAAAAGITPHILGDSMEGEARDVGKVMAGIALQAARRGQPFAAPCVLLSGGETTVTVRGQWTRRAQRRIPAVGCAIALRGEPGIHGLAGDTDGVDGQEEIAGAWISPDTFARAFEHGLRPRDSLDNNDGHRFSRRWATASSPALPSPTSTTSARC
jgi:glycerate 2-kinase